MKLEENNVYLKKLHLHFNTMWLGVICSNWDKLKKKMGRYVPKNHSCASMMRLQNNCSVDKTIQMRKSRYPM